MIGENPTTLGTASELLLKLKQRRPVAELIDRGILHEDLGFLLNLELQQHFKPPNSAVRMRSELEKRFARKLTVAKLENRFNTMIPASTPQNMQCVEIETAKTRATTTVAWENWSVEQVGEWISSQGGKAYQKIAQTFVENHIDGGMLLDVDIDSLQWMDTPKVFQQNLLKIIENLTRNSAQAPKPEMVETVETKETLEACHSGGGSVYCPEAGVHMHTRKPGIQETPDKCGKKEDRIQLCEALLLQIQQQKQHLKTNSQTKIEKGTQLFRDGLNLLDEIKKQKSQLRSVHVMNAEQGPNYKQHQGGPMVQMMAAISHVRACVEAEHDDYVEDEDSAWYD